MIVLVSFTKPESLYYEFRIILFMHKNININPCIFIVLADFFLTHAINSLIKLQKGKTVILLSLHFILNAENRLFFQHYTKKVITNMNVILENINH